MPCFVSMAGETAFLEVGRKLAQAARIISGQIHLDICMKTA